MSYSGWLEGGAEGTELEGEGSPSVSYSGREWGAEGAGVGLEGAGGARIGVGCITNSIEVEADGAAAKVAGAKLAGADEADEAAGEGEGG